MNTPKWGNLTEKLNNKELTVSFHLLAKKIHTFIIIIIMQFYLCDVFNIILFFTVPFPYLSSIQRKYHAKYCLFGCRKGTHTICSCGGKRATQLGSCVPFRLSQTLAHQPPGMDYTWRNATQK